MSDSKIVRIIQAIDRETKAGRIDWEVTEIEGVFQASFPNYSIRLSCEERDLGNDYWFTIINNEGLVIENISDLDLKAELDGAFRFMEGLYANSRRIALGVEKALDDLLSMFDDDLV